MLAPVKDEQGRVVGASSIARDVTSESRMQAALATTERRMANIIESAMDAIMTVDERQEIVMFNGAAEKMFGYRADEAMRQPLGRFLPERFRAAHEAHIQHFGETGVTARTMGRMGAIWGLRANGEEFPLEASISQVESEGRKLFTVILRDITERKRAERAAQAYTEELKRSNAELEQFAYVASHDLQEPLRMVASYTELLAERYRGKLDERADKYIGYAVDGAKRMQGLIHDLLAYARVSSQAKPLEPTDVSTVLDRVLEQLRGMIEKSQANVVRGRLPIVNADQGQLSQVFQNLIGNAIKFHGQTPPRVEISAQLSGELWDFAVADDGIGIAKENGVRIFQMFQRLHTREEYEGSGIGLAIAKRIVERHGGHIWFDSTPGKGTTFHFTIPRNGGNRDAEGNSDSSGGR